VKFNYTHGSSQDILSEIETAVREQFDKSNGGVPTVSFSSKSSAWVVRGIPWQEVRLTLCIIIDFSIRH